MKQSECTKAISNKWNHLRKEFQKNIKSQNSEAVVEIHMIGLSCGTMKMKIILNIYKGAMWLLFT